MFVIGMCGAFALTNAMNGQWGFAAFQLFLAAINVAVLCFFN